MIEIVLLEKFHHDGETLTRIITRKGYRVMHDVGVVYVGLEGDVVVRLITTAGTSNTKHS